LRGDRAVVRVTVRRMDMTLPCKAERNDTISTDRAAIVFHQINLAPS